MSNFGATFDYVCHPLHCPKCNTVASDPCAIDMQIKLGAQKELRSLRVGDHFKVSAKPELDGGYLRLSDRRDPDRTVAIETWTCPNCGTSFLWSRLVVEKDHVTSVEPIELSEASLSDADVITAEALMLFPMERTAEVRAMSVDKLRQELVAAVA